MFKIFIPEPVSDISLLPFLDEHSQAGRNRLFQSLPPREYAGIFERVSYANEADIVVVPHDYAYLHKHPAYLLQCQEHAYMMRKPLIIFAYQDDPRPITVSGAIIVRPSAYRSELGVHEILMPAYVEDIGAQYGKEPLSKGNKPIVAFTGKAGFHDRKEWLKYIVRNYIMRQGPHKQGIYFRRHALASLANDQRIECNTIIRKRYSAHRNTIEIPPAQAREEYIRSIQNAHFTLAPRGDGNYSLRFYETLSLGRIPVLIDTDTPLPLQDKIDYDACIVRVPWQEVDHVGDYIVRFFECHNEAQLREAQQRAREIFESFLYMPKFLNYLFAKIVSKNVILTNL